MKNKKILTFLLIFTALTVTFTGAFAQDTTLRTVPNNAFKQGEKLTLSHIEFACLPKCYAGLGITTGIQLYTWAQKNQNPPK